MFDNFSTFFVYTHICYHRFHCECTFVYNKRVAVKSQNHARVLTFAAAVVDKVEDPYK